MGLRPQRSQQSPIQKIVLPNGVRLLLRRTTNLPIVSMQVYFLGGVRDETPQTSGLCRLTARLMRKGTKTRTAEAIAEAFDSMGGSLSTSSGYNTFYVRAQVLKDDFQRAFEIFADVALHPTFPPDEFEKAKRLQLAAIARRADTPESEAAVEFRKTFFTRSPYRFTPLGETESVRAFGRGDVVSFYRWHRAPNRMVVAIFGDVDTNVARRLVQQTFGTVRPLSVPSTQRAAEPPLQHDRKRWLKTNKSRAVVYVGFRGTTIGDPDQYPMDVLDAIISGIGYPSGWLHETLRGRGLVYSVHAYSWRGLEPGFFAIVAMTNPEQVPEVLRLIDEQIVRMKHGEFTTDELTRAKRMCITMDQLSRQTVGDQAQQAALDELYGFGFDYRAQYPTRIEAVRAKDVRRVAQKYFTARVIFVASPQKPAWER